MAGSIERGPRTGPPRSERPTFLVRLDDPDRFQPQGGVAADVVQNVSGSTPRADEQDAGPIVRESAPTQSEQPALEPDTPEADEREGRTEHGDRDGDRTDPVVQHEVPERDDHHGGDPGEHHPARLLHARVPPHLPVEAIEVVREQVDDDDEGESRPESTPGTWRYVTVEPKDQRDQVRGQDDRQVDHRERDVPADASSDQRGQLFRSQDRGRATSTAKVDNSIDRGSEVYGWDLRCSSIATRILRTASAGVRPDARRAPGRLLRVPLTPICLRCSS